MVYQGEGTVGIIRKLFNGGATSEAAPARQLAGVIEEVGMALEVGHATVVGERQRSLLRHYLTAIRPRTLGRRSRGVGYVLGYATSGIEQVVLSHSLLGTLAALVDGIDIALHYPRTLGIAVFVCHVLAALLHIGRAKALNGLLHRLHLAANRHHVRIQTGIMYDGVTPEEPCLTVVVNHHRGVDVVPRAIFIERLADGITEGSGGCVAHSYTDGHAAADLGVGTDIPIVLTIALYGLRGPGTVVGPREGGEAEGCAVVGPVDHVGTAVDAPFIHPEEVGTVLIMAGIYINAVTTDQGSRVGGEPCLHYRIATVLEADCSRAVCRIASGLCRQSHKHDGHCQYRSHQFSTFLIVPSSL